MAKKNDYDPKAKARYRFADTLGDEIAMLVVTYSSLSKAEKDVVLESLRETLDLTWKDAAAELADTLLRFGR